MRISDWSSDVCSSDLGTAEEIYQEAEGAKKCLHYWIEGGRAEVYQIDASRQPLAQIAFRVLNQEIDFVAAASRSEEHTSELQSLMRISYAVFCLKNKNTQN